MFGRLVFGGVGFAVLSLAWLPSCGRGDDAGEPTSETAGTIGDFCTAKTDCAQGLCFEGSCTMECRSSDDCAGTLLEACGVTAEGSFCMRGCEYFRLGVTCIDDVPTACSVAGEGHCEDCGCPSTLRCEDGACVEKLAVGEPCAESTDCKSDNCSDFAGICRVPVGASCDASNCDGCLVSSGSSYCSRRCSSDLECGPGQCLGSDRDGYICRMPCTGVRDPTCPGSVCELPTGPAQTLRYYCDCLGRDCSWTEAPHSLGTPCSADSQCEGGVCDSAPLGTASSYTVVGLCTKPCATTEECGDGFSCVRTQATTICLPHCEESCSVGDCFDATDVEGDKSHRVCWAKAAIGAFCRQPLDCQTGNCVAQKCVAAGPQPNGAACRTDDDCVGRACQSGVCRGQALQGDPCQIPADCAVGTCCAAGAQAGTCALKCD